MNTPRDHVFQIKVLGRTLEHLGVQMYKNRAPALAELVANAWDAGAEVVRITVPGDNEYNQISSEIIIHDSGRGMAPNDVQDKYLVVGRNRRRDDGGISYERPVLGRKGIGKLAGFGIAEQMEVTTWSNGERSSFHLDIHSLKKEDDDIGTIEVPAKITSGDNFNGTDGGTIIKLRKLKHSTPIEVSALSASLARRFSRTIRGRMEIYVNDRLVEDPELEYENDVFEGEEKLQCGTVRYGYGFSKKTIKEKELRGFVVYVRGKTAQTSPFFFNIEGTASGQHSTRYVTGYIEADFLDAGTDDETDLISTDRQEIDWESSAVTEFREWGERLARKVLVDCSNLKGEKTRDWILDKEEFIFRIENLDPASQRQVKSFLKAVGKGTEDDRSVALRHADQLIKVYEYQHFYDVVDKIESVEDSPEQLALLLDHLHDWKVLESRAILEIIAGRLQIVKKFHSMIVNNAAETAHRVGDDNMHDLLGRYPWLLNPEWQVLAEEKTISKQMNEWCDEDIPDPEGRMRFDFLALQGDGELVIVEIKRSGHPVSLDELQRLEKYQDLLSKGCNGNITMMLVHGGNLDISDKNKKSWEERDDAELQTWGELHARVKRHYEDYRAVLDGSVDDPAFAAKATEVIKTKKVTSEGSVYRTPAERRDSI